MVCVLPIKLWYCFNGEKKKTSDDRSSLVYKNNWLLSSMFAESHIFYKRI